MTTKKKVTKKLAVKKPLIKKPAPRVKIKVPAIAAGTIQVMPGVQTILLKIFIEAAPGTRIAATAVETLEDSTVGVQLDTLSDENETAGTRALDGDDIGTF